WPAESRLLARAKPLARPIVRHLGLGRPGGLPPGSPSVVSQDFRPEHLVRALEESLRRLGTDYVDIYQLHSPPASVVAAGDFVDALEHLKHAGKLRVYGLAGDSAADLVEFGRHPGIASLQVPFSAIDQAAGCMLLPRAAGAGVGVIGRSCFAAGLLVGD